MKKKLAPPAGNVQSLPGVPAPVNPFQPQSKAQIPTPTPAPASTNVSKDPQVIRDQDTGKISGVILPDGTPFLGRTHDVTDFTNAALKKSATPAGTVEATAVGAQQQQQQQGAALSSTLGQDTPAQQAELAAQTPQDFSTSQALLAGAQGAVGTAVNAGLKATGLTAGAAGGAAIAAGAGASAVAGTIAGPALIVGGAVTAVSIYNGIRENIKKQAQGNVQSSQKVLLDGKNNLNNLIKLANQDPAHAEQYRDDFNQQLFLIEKAYGQLNLDTKRNAKLFADADGTPVLQGFADFYSDGGRREQSITRMAIALQNPDPSINLFSQDDLSYESAQ